jgi:hypothetical protein
LDHVNAGVFVPLTVLMQPAVTTTNPANAAKIFVFILLQCNPKRRARQARFAFTRGFATFSLRRF